MQFSDVTITPVIATLLGFTVTVLLLALPMYRYKGKVSESSFLLRFSLVILLAFGVGTTLFVYYYQPVFILFAGCFIVIPVSVCYLLAHVCKKETEKW
jgi:hypothetical protein